MRIRLALIFLTLLSSAMAFAKEREVTDTISARRAFLEMPAGVLDLLSHDTRLDMLTYYDNDSTYRATNNLNGLSTLQTVTPDFLSVQLTDVSSMQFKVLRLKDGKEILMTIYSTGGEGESIDSDIQFYDADLRPLKKEKYFPTPELGDFFDLKGYKTKLKEIREMMPFYTIMFEANPDNSNVTGTLTVGDTLTLEDLRIIEMFRKPNVTFLWNGKEFKLMKK